METSGRFCLALIVIAISVVGRTSATAIGQRLGRQEELVNGSFTEEVTLSPKTVAESATSPLSQQTSSPTVQTDSVSPTSQSALTVLSPEETARCEAAATNWTPWTAKWENINRDDCGRRRRTRKIKTEEMALMCELVKFQLYEFQEFCQVNTRNEVTIIFQFYFVDEIFGYSAQLANDEQRRRKRRQAEQTPRFFWPLIFNRALHDTSKCNDDVSQRPVDFLVMLDKSGSMSRRQFRQLIKSITFLVKIAIPKISPSTTRMAMLTFANRPTVEFDFKKCKDDACVQKEVKNANFTGGITRMAHALEEAETVFTKSRGMRDCSRRVILLITDGSGSHEHINPEVPARNLRVGKGVEIFVVGVTHLINEEQLQSIASSPVLTHLFFMPSARTVRRVCKSLKPAKAHE